MSVALLNFQRALVRVLDAAGSLCGMGFLVSPRQVLTCAHVVADALRIAPDTREAPAGEVAIAFPFGEGRGRMYPAIVAQKHGWYPRQSLDLALLHLHEALPLAGYERISQADSIAGERFQAWGAQEGHEEDLVPIEGMVGQTIGNGRYMADVRDSNYKIRRGCSGAPVVSPATGLILGMIVQEELDERAQSGFVIPAAWLLQVLGQAGPVLERTPLDAVSAWAKDRYGSSARLRPQVLKFISSYEGQPGAPRPFVGRSAILRQLDLWLAGNEPFKLLGGPAGRGKSALLLHWLGTVIQPRRHVTVFYVSISLRFGTATETAGVELLFAALSDVFSDLKKDFPQQPDTRDYLVRIAEAWEHMAQRPQQAYLLVIDGMDEAIHPWLSSLDIFPGELPPNLHVLISARHKPGHSDSLAWLDELRIPGISSRAARQNLRWILELDTLDRDAMAEAVVQLDRPLNQLAERESFVDQLYRLTDNGDPLLLDLWLGEIWKAHCRSPDLDAQTLAGFKPGFGELYRIWLNDQQLIWKAENLRVHEEDFHRVMRVLAVAREPMRVDDVLAVVNGIDMPMIGGVRELRDVLKAAHRLVLSDGDHYVLVHPRLAGYFLEEDPSSRRFSDVRAVRESFRKWGADVVRRLNSSEQLPISGSAPEECPTYLLSHYVTHLDTDSPIDSRLLDEHCLPLLRQGWARAWYAREGAWQGYLNDLHRVLLKVQSFNRDLAGFLPGGLQLAAEVRCVLLGASIRSLTGNVPMTLVVRLVEEGVWLLERGGSVAAHYDPDRQAECLTKLAAVARDRRDPERARWFLKKALEAIASLQDAYDGARSREEDYGRIELLDVIAGQLRGEPTLLQQALQAAGDIRDERFRSNALKAVAGHLQGEPALLQQALQAVAGILDEDERSFALGAVARYLQGNPELLQQAFQVAAGIGSERARACALSAIAKEQQGEPKRNTLRQAFQAAASVQQEYDRASALNVVAEQLQGEPKRKVLQQVLQVVAAIEGGYRQYVLGAVVEQAQGEPALLQQAVQAVADIQDEGNRLFALEAVAAKLRGEPVSLRRALQVVASIGDERYRAKALSVVSSQLRDEPGLLQQALRMAASLRDRRDRTEALEAVAAQLQGKPALLQEALQVLLVPGDLPILDDHPRARVLKALVAQLQGEPRLLQQALQVATTFHYADNRAHALSAIGAQLSGETRRHVLQQALQAAASIDSNDLGIRSSALTAIAAQLSGDWKRQVLQQAFQATVSIKEGGKRVGALVAIARQLSGESKRHVLQQALQVAASILDPEDGAWQSSLGDEEEARLARAIGRLAEHLEGERALLQQALKVAASIQSAGLRAQALCYVVAQLQHEPQLLQQTLQAAASIRDEPVRASVLARMAESLQDGSRRIVLEQALLAASTIRDASERALALSNVAAQLQGELRSKALKQALEATADIRNRSRRYSAFGWVAQHLNDQPALLPQALEVAQSAGALREIALLLKGEAGLLQKALQAAAAIQKESERFHALRAVAEQLHGEPALLQLALQAAAAIHDPFFRSLALSAVAVQVSGDRKQQVLQQALQAAADIQYELWRFDALSAVAAQLQGGPKRQVLQQALQLADSIKDADQGAGKLHDIIERLRGEPTLLQQALRVAGSIQEEWYRSRALGWIAVQLQGEPALLQKVLQAVANIRDAGPRAFGLSALAEQLQGEPKRKALEQAIHAAASIQWPDRFGVVSKIAAQLEGDPKRRLLHWALQAIATVQDEKERSEALCGIATHLEGERGLTQQALQIIAGMQVFRVQPLHAVSQNLQGEPALLEQALELVAGIREERSRAIALSAVAQQLSGDSKRQLLQQALRLVAEMRDERDRAAALGGRFWEPQPLQAPTEPGLLQQAVRAAAGICGDSAGEFVVEGGVGQMESEPELLQEALRAMAGLREEEHRFSALRHIARQLKHPASTLLTYDVWSYFLTHAHLSRPRLLEVAVDLAGMAVGLTGRSDQAAAIAVAIGEVSTWFP